MIHDREKFVRKVAQSVVSVTHSHFDDLCQIGSIQIWRIMEKNAQFPIRYYWIAARYRMIGYLEKQRKYKIVHRPDYQPHSSSDPAMIVEHRDLMATAKEWLFRNSSSEDQGVKDILVMEMCLSGSSYTEIAQRCPWLKGIDSVAKALERIVTTLRERFGSDLSLPIELKRKSSQEKRTHNNKEYQKEWYSRPENQKRRSQAATENRKRRILYSRLLAASFSRYGEANSGASSYYVHSNGFRVRVSDHAPRSKESLDLIAEGKMVSILIDRPLRESWKVIQDALASYV